MQVSKTYKWKGPTAEERVKRAKFDHGTRKSYAVVWPPRDPADLIKPTIGHNNAPRYDPDKEVTGFPGVLRDIQSFTTQDGTEITSRSKKRQYEKENGVEFTGVEYTACSDLGKPEWFDEYKEHRKERQKARKRGKADPGTFHERMKRDKRSMAPKVKFKDGKEQW